MNPFGPPPLRRSGPQFDPIQWILRSPRRMFMVGWGAVLAALLVWGVLSSFYTVQAFEEAVVLRFGSFHAVNGPGFHGRLPWGIDKVYKGEVTTVLREEFGYRTISSGVRSEFDYDSPQLIAEATMLTGDLNLAIVNWEVRFKIRSLREFLFEVEDPTETLRDVSQAVMRAEVGNRSVDEVLTLDRPAIEVAVAERMQVQLDGYKCGIHIVKVNLKRVDPPAEVKDAFNEVNRSIQERDRIINEAEGQRNEKIPAARGAADRMIKEAEGYKIGRKNRADGDVQAFLAILGEYRKAEDVTRRRLYLEAMAELLPKLGDITIIDGGQGGVLKHLDLGREEGR
jgi:membrane protease subunit HflK